MRGIKRREVASSETPGQTLRPDTQAKRQPNAQTRHPTQASGLVPGQTPGQTPKPSARPDASAAKKPVAYEP